jgi:hypothetical protein
MTPPHCPDHSAAFFPCRRAFPADPYDTMELKPCMPNLPDCPHFRMKMLILWVVTDQQVPLDVTVS